MTLDELFKKVFPGLTYWIEKIKIAKEETITPKKTPSDTKALKKTRGLLLHW